MWCGICVHFTVYQPNKKYKKTGHIQRKYDCCELSRLYHIGVGYWCIVKLNLKAMINHRVGKSILNPDRLSPHCWYYSNIIQWFCCSFSLYLGTLKKVPKKIKKWPIQSWYQTQFLNGYLTVSKHSFCLKNVIENAKKKIEKI